VTIVDWRPGVKLVGKLDKLELVGDGAVNVVDYKTKKPMSRNQIEGLTKAGNGDFKRQLVFYKLLLEKGEEAKYKMKSGEIDFTEPDDKGKFKKEKFEITDGEVAELETVIEKAVGEIKELSFWDKTCLDKDCEYCRLRQVIGR
jgi:hypothetical protein